MARELEALHNPQDGCYACPLHDRSKMIGGEDVSWCRDLGQELTISEVYRAAPKKCRLRRRGRVITIHVRAEI